MADRARLQGVWKLVSHVIEDVDTKEQIHWYGERPRGYLHLLPSGRMIGIFTSEERAPPTTADDALAAIRSMVAYSGTYRLEAGKFITKVEVAWNESWVGTEQVRFFRVEDDTLHIETAPAPAANLPGRVVRSTLSWVREE